MTDKRNREDCTYPFQTFVETISRSSTSRLDVPSTLPQRVQAQLVSDLCRIHRVGQILFVRKHEQEGVTEFVLVQHALEFFTSFGNSVAIVRVDYEDDTLGVLEVWQGPVNEGRVSSRRLILESEKRNAYNASREDESCLVLRHPTR